MTIEHHYSLADLARILGALENTHRNPNTKRNAMKAIARNAAQIGLTADDVFDTADGLLSGRLSAAEWRAQLRDDGGDPATEVAEPTAKPVDDDAPAEADVTPEAPPVTKPRARAGSRPNTKQAMMIAMLKRPEGATIAQIAEATGWQHHYAEVQIMPR